MTQGDRRIVTGRERVEQLVEALESWCWAHTEERPRALEEAMVADLDALEGARARIAELESQMRAAEAIVIARMAAAGIATPADGYALDWWVWLEHDLLTLTALLERYRAERDEARREVALRDKRIAELETIWLEVSRIAGISYEADGVAPAPGPTEQVLSELQNLRRRAEQTFELSERIAELESSTEWRPIETAPEEVRVLVKRKSDGRAMIAVRCGDIWDSSMSCDWASEELAGWLPLPGGAS